MNRKVIRIITISLLILLAVVVLLVPDQYWPLEWVRYREYEGEFKGHPVVLAPPHIRRATLPLEYRIEMESGVCQLSRIDSVGHIIPHQSLGQGYVMRDSLPAGEQLQLDPGSGKGHYSVGIGLKWHLLSPHMWRSIARGMIGGMLAVLVFIFFSRGRKLAWQMTLTALFTPWQWAILLALAVLSGTILYSAIHESGHALAAIALGGRVSNVVFTSLRGDEPHVIFGYLPEGAGPWMQAGGVFLPILVAYGLLIVWLMLGRRLSRFRQTLLLIPALLFLFASFGSLFDDHLRGMALCLGFSSRGGILLVKLIPACLTLAAYAVVIWRRKLLHGQR